MTINAQFVVGEEVVAEGVIDLVSDEIDERQGVKIELNKRGVTT
jgi:RNA-binding protein YhbY